MNITLLGTLDAAIIESTTDGTGIRLVLFTAGCPHHCPGCHNARSWDKTNGTAYDVVDVAQRLVSRFRAGRYAGITFSGGDPLAQPDALFALARLLRADIPDLNLWCYTGYLYEQVAALPVLAHFDVLVDGPFHYHERLPKKPFRGSANQRLLHLVEGRIVAEA